MPSTQQHQPHTPTANTDDPLRERDLVAIVGGGVKVDYVGLDRVTVTLTASQFDRLIEAATDSRGYYAGQHDVGITITEANRQNTPTEAAS